MQSHEWLEKLLSIEGFTNSLFPRLEAGRTVDLEVFQLDGSSSCSLVILMMGLPLSGAGWQAGRVGGWFRVAVYFGNLLK